MPLSRGWGLALLAATLGTTARSLDFVPEELQQYDDHHRRTMPWSKSSKMGLGLGLVQEPEMRDALDLGVWLAVPLLAVLLLVSLRMQLRSGAALKAGAASQFADLLEAGHVRVRRLAAGVMRTGPVPRHVAFIMDGNRRWAKELGVKTLKGHNAGYEAMCGILEHCKDLGVEVVTVYAFSIENFKRSQEEVNHLMELAMAKFEDAILETGDLHKHRVRVRVLGDLSLLPKSVQEASARVTFSTAKNDGPICNICLSYTSQEEMAATVRSLVEGVERGELEPEDLDVELIGRAMYTADLPTPDLLVRTSGETRLSDFMLWQCATAQLAFTPVLWPSFSWWQLMKILLDFQRHYGAMMQRRAHHAEAQAKLDEARAEAELSRRRGPRATVEGVLQERRGRQEGFLAGLAERRKEALAKLLR